MTETVGPYRVIRPIGAGGSARVDLAVLRRAYGFERQVVLKRPLEHLRADPDVRRMFAREASLGGRLVHPNLVAMLDAGTDDGVDYLVLEHVDGASLRELMRESSGELRPISRGAALTIVIDAARGLHEAHELADADGSPLGLVHRDVTPANVLLAYDGSVKVADFGIAKETRVDTLSGSMRGTVTYMSPEQCRGHAFDRRADVFALGVILHELLTRRRLFAAESDVASLHRVLSDDIPDPRAIDPSIPSELAAVTLRALARDQLERVASAGELADLLEEHATRAGIITGRREVVAALARSEETAPRVARMRIVVPESTAVSPRRRRFLAIPLAALTAVSVAAIVWYTASSRDAETPPPAAPAPTTITLPAQPAAPSEPTAEAPVSPPPAPAAPAPRPRTRRHAAIAPKRAPVPDKPAAGSGNVEWNRTLLLPTDGAKTK